MNLYQIDKAIEDLINDCIDTETGEFDEFRFSEIIGELKEAKTTKVENIALYIKGLTAEVNAISEEEKNLANRRRAKERHAESLKRYLGTYLNGQKFETAKTKISFRTNKRLEVSDEAAAVVGIQAKFLSDDEEAFLDYQLPKIKRAAVKSYLLSHPDVHVAGMDVVESRSMTIK